MFKKGGGKNQPFFEPTASAVLNFIADITVIIHILAAVKIFVPSLSNAVGSCSKCVIYFVKILRYNKTVVFLVMGVLLWESHCDFL